MADQIPMGALAGDYERCAQMLDDAMKRIAELEPAYALLKRIAEKAVEPVSDSADPNKTIGQIRSEMVPLLQEAVSFFMGRERPTDA